MILSVTGKTFLLDLTSRLDKIGLRHVILRNYETLPDSIGNDLDIHVGRDKIPQSLSELDKCVKYHGGRLIHIHRRGYVAACWVDFQDQEAYMHIDFYDGALEWHGFPFITEKWFEESRREYGDWIIPKPAHEAVILACTSILWGGFFKEKYLPQIFKLTEMTSERIFFNDCLIQAFGSKGAYLASAILDGIIRESDTHKLASILRRRLAWHCFKRSPLKALRGWINHWVAEARCYLAPLGLRISHPPLDSVAQQNLLAELEKRISGMFGGVAATSKNSSFWGRIRDEVIAFRRLGNNWLLIEDGSQWSIGNQLVDAETFGTDYKDLANAIEQTMLARVATHLDFSRN